MTTRLDTGGHTGRGVRASPSELANTTRVTRRTSARLGGVAFLVGSAVVHVGNYMYNVVMGRMLGPGLFSDLAVIVTLLLVATLSAGSLQTAAAKMAAEPGGPAAQHWMRRRAVYAGIAVAGAMALASRPLAGFFHAASAWPFTIFGLGLPALLAQAVDRGFLLGTTRFGRLTVSYQAEMWVRLGGALVLLWTGVGLNGVVAALSLSFLVGWMAAARPRRRPPLVGDRSPVGAAFGAAGLLAIGEVLVNHSDLLIVKHFTEPAIAGAYGAIAVVGRIPIFVAWSLGAVAFPYVAAGNPAARRRAIGAVAAAGGIFTAAAWAAPEVIVDLLFGDAFAEYAPYLALYAAATSLFAIARTQAFLGLAEGRPAGAVLVLVAGIAQTAALWRAGGAVIVVVPLRLLVVATLLAAVTMWGRRVASSSGARPGSGGSP